jgi:hypothetical protein
MVTIIHFTNGRSETFQDAAPTVDTQEAVVALVDDSMTTVSEEYPLSQIERIEFIP